MNKPPPLPPDVLASLPPAVVALFEYLAARVAALEAEIEGEKTPANASLLPSTARPRDKRKPTADSR